MIKLQATRIIKTDSKPLHPAVKLQEEGQALVLVKVDGNAVVQPSLGVAGEVFVGVAYSRAMPPHFAVRVETDRIRKNEGENDALVFHTQRIPQAGTVALFIDGELVTDIGADATAPDAAGKANISRDGIWFHAGDEGKAFEIVYKHELSVSEARELTGDEPLGGLSANVQGELSYVTIGSVATTMFDTAADWRGVINPFLGADGLFTATAPSADAKPLANVHVLNSPSADNEFLLLDIKCS